MNVAASPVPAALVQTTLALDLDLVRRDRSPWGQVITQQGSVLATWRNRPHSGSRSSRPGSSRFAGWLRASARRALPMLSECLPVSSRRHRMTYGSARGAHLARRHSTCWVFRISVAAREATCLSGLVACSRRIGSERVLRSQVPSGGRKTLTWIQATRIRCSIEVAVH